MAGAAYLNAHAAYMAGAGLVRIYTAKDNRAILQTLLPEAIITTYEDFEQVEVILQESEWKRFFPEEWLNNGEEDCNGKKE